MKQDTQLPAVDSPTRTRRIRSFVSRHRKAVAAVVLAGVALAIFAFLWFRPDTLFRNTRVNEAAPTTAAQPTQNGATAPAAPAAAVVSTGRFRNLEHPTSGTAKIIRLANGSHIVRLENFRTSSGPDVFVALSSTPATEDSWGAYDDDELLLLRTIKGNVGDQNYTIPKGTDLSRYQSVVIWCRRFRVGFGAAPIV